MHPDDSISIFGGSGSPYLTTAISEHLEVRQGEKDVIHFSEGTIFVRIRENVRGKDIFLVQSTAYPVNDNFMELLFWVDAFRRASAASVTILVPYFAYAKGDKKDEPRVSIRARVCADALQAAGANRIVFLDLHAPQIQGFFTIPVDDLRAYPTLCKALAKELDQDSVVVSPDVGFVKTARSYAETLGLPLAIANKSRKGHDERAEVYEIIGDVKDKTALIVDDFSTTGGTLIEAAKRLRYLGARRIIAAITHCLFNEEGIAKLEASPIERLYCTDSVESVRAFRSSKLEIVSIAPLLGEAIRRIHERRSISVLFESPR